MTENRSRLRPVTDDTPPLPRDRLATSSDPIRNAEKAGALLAAAIDALLAEQANPHTERN